MVLEDPQRPEIDAELAWFTRHPDYLERVARRARPFLHLIVTRLRERGMPLDLALLPVVESGFEPYAYSPGRAAGIWQFIPSTGRHFGLRQNWWYDGRRDIVASTGAALDYLGRLYRRFGDWELAIAAYNCGARTVERAIEKNHRAGRPTGFWSLDLPAETRSYLPRLLAVRRAFQAPERFGLNLPELPDEPLLEEVDARGQIDLARAAEMAGLEMEAFYRLNPAYNRWATPPDGPHRFLLPKANADRFRTALAGLPEEERVVWRRHLIREGETLSHIARRHHLTVAALMRVNHLRDHRIRAGRYLLIPSASRPLTEYSQSVEARRQRRLNASGKGEKHIVTVRPGDTLWDLARAHGVSLRRLSAWNGIAPRDTLHPGQKLVLWKEAPASGSAPEKVAETLRPTRRTIRYRVRAGDSLWEIASRFSVSVSELCRWNGIPRNQILQPGQHLRLFVDVTEQSGSGRG
ncbi:MAG: LysM peptidoglycan-binding domain-containing protein [Gammaproteobacteria bacterium]|nr:MAG: LysM peptidoglycan-binding domain-containing protein [Gammaproteobacteria bacterium]